MWKDVCQAMVLVPGTRLKDRAGKREFLPAVLVKNPPAMQETWVRSLGWEDPLEKGMATHSSILAWRIQSMESTKSRTQLSDFDFCL